MAKLEEYQNLGEKKQFFVNGDAKFDHNVAALFNNLDRMIEQKDFIFRGSNEAKYKLYNSAQRVFIETGLHIHGQDNAENFYDKWIESLVEECKKWNNGTIANLLTASGVNINNSLAYLSYMQHYGMPTPLLDFTEDPYIALFFAIDSLQVYGSDKEIDNYFSLYFTFKDNGAFNGMEVVFSANVPDIKSNGAPYMQVSKNMIHLLRSDTQAYELLNNTNIINQKGLFFLNADPYMPLEAKFKEFVDLIKKEINENILEDIVFINELGGCFNIHKSLAPYIKDALLQRGLSRDFIYPDPYKIKNEIVNKLFSKIGSVV